MSEHTSWHDYNAWQYLVIDTETGVHNTGEGAVGNMMAAPFHPDNSIVLGGAKTKEHGFVIQEGAEYLRTSADKLIKNHVIVGHNLKFDLLYFFKRYDKECWDITDWLLNKVLLWDTMLVEYLISGQQDKFASLDKLAVKYGGTIKDSNIKKYWEDGVATEDIPKDELSEYLKEDLKNTELIYLAQKDIVARMLGMGRLIYLEMESLKDTIIAEWNGMYVNMNELAMGATDLSKRLQDVEENLKILDPNINWNSPKQLQAFFFGGNVLIGTADVPTGEFYKTGSKKGLAKTRKMPVAEIYPGLLSPFLGELGVYSMDTSEENLKEIAVKLSKSLGTHRVIATISMLLNYRKLTKDFKTYYVGIAKLVWPNDSCVHGNFNHTATDTGRLSCNSPNLQNITSLE